MEPMGSSKYIKRPPRERGLAKSLDQSHYFTGRPCSRGHIDKRQTKSGQCAACNRENAAGFRAENPERTKEINEKSFKKHYVKRRADDNASHTRKYWADPEAARILGRVRTRKWQKENPDYGRDYMREQRAANPEKFRKRAREAFAADPEKFRKRARKARAADPEKHRKKANALRAKNIKRYRAAERRRYFLANTEECLAREKERKDRAANPEKYKKSRRERRATYQREHRAANLEKYRKRDREDHKTPRRQLRVFCGNTARALELGQIAHSRFNFLDYGPDEFISHLVNTIDIPVTSFKEARMAGYHVDHIIPLAFISAALPMDKAGRILAFQVAMDLKNLRMISGFENMSKGARLDLDPVQAAIFEYLCEKYGVAREMIVQAIPY